MSEHYTVAECRALLATREGRHELERAIALACGIEPGPWWCDTCREAVPESDVTPTLHHKVCGWSVVEALHTITPPYLTTAEGAEGYGDRCWEMIEALTRAGVQKGDCPGVHYARGDVLRVAGAKLAALEAATLADALCLALAAARLLKKE